MIKLVLWLFVVGWLILAYMFGSMDGRAVAEAVLSSMMAIICAGIAVVVKINP